MNSNSIILIMLGAGALGGLASFIIAKRNNAAVQYKLYEALLLGVIAAATVPLFLNITSSNMLAEDKITNYYIFAGFCILAGMSAVSFLKSLSDQALKIAQEAKATAEEAKDTAADSQDKVDTVITTQANPATDENGATRTREMPSGNPEDRVMQYLRSHAAKFHASEIVSDVTGVTHDEVIGFLQKWETEGLVKRVTTSKGAQFWAYQGK